MSPHRLITSSPHHPPGGFTLFELILVMFILTIAMAIVAPSLSQFLHGRKSADAVNQVVALARHARAQALAEGKIYRLHVDTKAGEYWIDARDGANYAAVEGDHGEHYRFPEGMKASWHADENAPVFPVNTANQQQSSTGMSSGFGASGGLGKSGGLGGGQSGLGGAGGQGAPGGQNQQNGKSSGGDAQNPRAQSALAESAVCFYPDGRNDTLILSLDYNGEKFELGAWSETESWGVMREEDR